MLTCCSCKDEQFYLQSMKRVTDVLGSKRCAMLYLHDLQVIDVNVFEDEKIYAK
jgi:hypothetical protein